MILPFVLLHFLTARMGLLPTTASATTIGHKSCADAEVIASIKNQGWDPLYEAWPKASSAPLKGQLRINLDIEKVVFGPIAPGTVAIMMQTRTKIDAGQKRFRIFLDQSPAGDWWAATCDFKF